MPPRPRLVVSEMGDTSTLTAENFEKELKALASQAKEQTWAKTTTEQIIILVKAGALLTLAAAYSTASQLSLSPVYGGIPASIWHSKGVMTACFLGWSGNLWLRRLLPRNPIFYLPILAAYIPMLQFFLFKQSEFLGATYGPITTEALTYLPLLALSVTCTATILESLDLDIFGKWIADAAPGIGSYAFFRTMEAASKTVIEKNIGSAWYFTRMGLEMVLSACYVVFSPTKLLLYSTVPALFHTFLFNIHMQSTFTDLYLDEALDTLDFGVIERHESVTGYISVLQSYKERFTVMRCDHSILGGNWMPDQGWVPDTQVREPVYGIFVMLEAVRLVDKPQKVADDKAKALVIGLGIGTTPSALIAHGIDTTIVEIDPIVFDYAVKHFSLPKNHKKVVADAVSYAAEAATNKTEIYDYIVHDVFTGGAEPVDLFTLEFITDLYTLLKPEGVIAINYAGDLFLPSARLVVRTIKAVFPTCRIFREYATPSAKVLKKENRDFTNMVIFCTKFKDTLPGPHGPLTFRQPVVEDYLGSRTRVEYLLPKFEIEEKVFWEKPGDADVLRRNDTGRLTQWQQQSALGHWALMRTVLPPGVWVAW